MSAEGRTLRECRGPDSRTTTITTTTTTITTTTTTPTTTTTTTSTTTTTTTTTTTSTTMRERTTPESTRSTSHFQIDDIRERIRKIKLKAPTPLAMVEKDPFETMMEGIPDGEPGLKNDFFERIPFLPDSLTATERIPTRIASIGENDLPSIKTSVIFEKTVEPKSNNVTIMNAPKNSVDLPKQVMEPHMNEKLPISQNMEENIKNIFDDTKFEKPFAVAMKTEKEIKKVHNSPKIANQIPIAVEVEKAIQRNQEQVMNEAMISNKGTDKSDLIMTITKLDENLDVGTQATEIPTTVFTYDTTVAQTEEPSLSIFNTTDLVLTDFTVSRQVANGNEKNETLIASPTEIVIPNDLQKTNAFSPTKIPSNPEHKMKKMRRRKFFRKNFSRKPTDAPTTIKSSEIELLQLNEKSTRRPFTRNLSKPKKDNEVKEITIEEKPNPRRIIFRKGLTNTHRRRLSQKTKKDPLVASLLSQIKKQRKGELFRRKNRPNKGAPSVEKVQISARSKNLDIPIKSSKSSSIDEDLIEELQEMEIMRKNNDSYSSTTVSSTTVLVEHGPAGSAESTTSLKDFTDTVVTTENPVPSVVPTESSSTVKKVDLIKTSIVEGQNTIHTSSNEIEEDVITEAPDMYETSTVIATSISTSEAISYFSAESLSNLQSV